MLLLMNQEFILMELLKNAASYESITPELVGRKRRFVIGKHMGTHGFGCLD